LAWLFSQRLLDAVSMILRTETGIFGKNSSVKSDASIIAPRAWLYASEPSGDKMEHAKAVIAIASELSSNKRSVSRA